MNSIKNLGSSTFTISLCYVRDKIRIYFEQYFTSFHFTLMIFSFIMKSMFFYETPNVIISCYQRLGSYWHIKQFPNVTAIKLSFLIFPTLPPSYYCCSFFEASSYINSIRRRRYIFFRLVTYWRWEVSKLNLRLLKKKGFFQFRYLTEHCRFWGSGE